MPNQTLADAPTEDGFSGTENSAEKINMVKDTLRETENHDETIRHLLANYDLGCRHCRKGRGG